MLVEARGPAHADEVWRRFTDPGTWSSWAHLIQDVDADDPVLVPGTRGRVRGPAGAAVDFRVTAVDPELRSWSWSAGRGPAAVRMDHHVLPAVGGGSRAVLRVAAPAAAALQPYRIPAAAALRRLVGATGRSDGSPEAVHPFDFAFAPSYALAGRAFGVAPATATVEVGPHWLYVRYGPWRLVTPRSNIASTQVTGGFRWIRTAGPAHLSLGDRGVSFTSNGDRALCLTFREPVPAIDPTGSIRHPNATLSVAEPERLAEALDARP